MAKACQLFSGSSGNSIFIADKGTKILVDTGVTAKRIEEGLGAIGESAEELSAIFITHEHFDHVKGLRVLASRHKIPVFADGRVIDRLRCDRYNDYSKIELIEISENFELSGIEAVPFELSHDSAACIGYRFNLSGGKSVSVCTDTGYIPVAAKKALKGSQLVFLESNHEVMMLENGPYPYLLKQRILSRKGHLSNADCAEFAVQLLQNGTTRINLSHISLENNTPDIARVTTQSALTLAGFKEDYDYKLTLSPTENKGKPIIL